MDDAHRARQTELDGPVSDLQRVFGILDAAAQHGVDIHLKDGVLGQQGKLLVEHFQALHGHFIGHGVVDADLQVLQTSPIQPPDPLGGQQIAVRNHSSNHSAAADVPDDLIELGM